MNNSIQVLKTADIMVGEHQMMEDSGTAVDDQINTGQQELKPTNNVLDGADVVNEARNEMTSVMSSLNQSLLDNQPSNAISQSFVDLEQEEEELTSYDNAYETKQAETIKNVKEAIIDLYLAIKIRSTEELDQINESNLRNEKSKLLKSCDCFQILEYIRSSIEIIMNLKIEDLEKNDQKKRTDATARGQSTNRRGLDTEMSLSGISVASQNLIL